VADTAPETQAGAHGVEGRHDYLARVLDEIDQEVVRRRSSGDLPPRVERELDAMFLRYSPMGGDDGTLDEVLDLVESSSFIDPVVPIASSRSGGGLTKRTIRRGGLWYMGWVTHQVSEFASATSRALRVLDHRVRALRNELDAQRVPTAAVIEAPWAHHPGAWWVDRALDSLAGQRGRVLHAAAGDGWLVRRLRAAGLDAYGVEPRADRVTSTEIEGLDLREEPVLGHLRAIAPEALGGVVLSGVVDAMTAAEREVVVALAAQKVAPSGHVIIHSLSPKGWVSEEAPVEADLASGRPLRPRTWAVVFGRLGFEVEVIEGPTSDDYLVVAVSGGGGEGRAVAG
jgi:hypothetical protein